MEKFGPDATWLPTVSSNQQIGAKIRVAEPGSGTLQEKYQNLNIFFEIFKILIFDFLLWSKMQKFNYLKNASFEINKNLGHVIFTVDANVCFSTHVQEKSGIQDRQKNSNFHIFA